MVDVVELQTDAEEAQITGEMALTRLSEAKAVLAERQERFAQSLERRRTRERRSADGPATPRTPE